MFQKPTDCDKAVKIHKEQVSDSLAGTMNSSACTNTVDGKVQYICEDVEKSKSGADGVHVDSNYNKYNIVKVFKKKCVNLDQIVKYLDRYLKAQLQ